MAATFICDGCGKQEPAIFYPGNPHNWQKPDKWYQRSDKDGPMDACSRECVDKASKARGKSNVVLPL